MDTKHKPLPLDFQTEEDQEINRALSRRLGTWKWGDNQTPSGRYRISERAIGMTGSRVGFANFVRWSR